MMANLSQLTKSGYVDQAKLDTQCLVCGRDHSVAYWMGSKGCLVICYPCAIDILPRLLADAVVAAAHGGTVNLNAAWKEAAANFYYAAATALAHERRLRTDPTAFL